jgi:hypothetical protein
MRRTLTVCRTGLSMAAAVVLLSACGGSGNDTAASSSSSARSSASESSTGTGAGAGSEFCTQAASALSSVEPALSGSENDPASLGPALQQAAEKVRAIDPPSEISSDWAALADGIEKIAQIVVREGTAEPTSTAAQQEVGAVIGSLSNSATKVQTYLSTKCGLQAPTGTAAPTS